MSVGDIVRDIGLCVVVVYFSCIFALELRPGPDEPKCTAFANETLSWCIPFSWKNLINPNERHERRCARDYVYMARPAQRLFQINENIGRDNDSNTYLALFGILCIGISIAMFIIWIGLIGLTMCSTVMLSIVWLGVRFAFFLGNAKLDFTPTFFDELAMPILQMMQEKTGIRIVLMILFSLMGFCSICKQSKHEWPLRIRADRIINAFLWTMWMLLNLQIKLALLVVRLVALAFVVLDRVPIIRYIALALAWGIFNVDQ